jgi:outer membrane protein OmpA-like peptidoglycan-associated protein
MIHFTRGAAAGLGLAAVCAPAPAQSEPAIRAVHYPHLDGSTLIAFRGTDLEPGARGQAILRTRGGSLRMHAHFAGLGEATRFGPEYLTYVLWALSPQGRAVNLGEVVPVRGRAHLDAVVPMRTFALLVTAEPHFAVGRLSRAVILQNDLVKGSRLELADQEVRMEGLERWDYLQEKVDGPMPEEAGISRYVFQARNAVRLARADRADVLAPAEFASATRQLDRMEAEPALDRPSATLLALETAQRAEDARLAAVRRQAATRLAEEKIRADQALVRLEAVQNQLDVLRSARQEGEAEGLRQATEAQLALRRRLQERLGAILHTRDTPEGLLATLTDVSFPSGSDRLSPLARERLAQVSGILLAHPGLHIRITGHTDGTGRPAFNERLSQARAEAVRRFLVQRGIPLHDLEAVGLAGTRPVASDGTVHGRSLNRRVDLIIRGTPIGR